MNQIYKKGILGQILKCHENKLNEREQKEKKYSDQVAGLDFQGREKSCSERRLVQILTPKTITLPVRQTIHNKRKQ